jgi:hypothetical protein
MAELLPATRALAEWNLEHLLEVNRPKSLLMILQYTYVVQIFGA